MRRSGAASTSRRQKRSGSSGQRLEPVQRFERLLAASVRPVERRQRLERGRRRARTGRSAAARPAPAVANDGVGASRLRCSSSASVRAPAAPPPCGRPASAATCRPKLRLAGPSFTACMNTSCVAVLDRVQVHVGDAAAGFGQRGQFEVVRGEQRVGAVARAPGAARRPRPAPGRRRWRCRGRSRPSAPAIARWRGAGCSWSRSSRP